MVCGLFSSSFITNFVVVTILLMLDFWTVCSLCGPSTSLLFFLLPFRHWLSKCKTLPALIPCSSCSCCTYYLTCVSGACGFCK